MIGSSNIANAVSVVLSAIFFAGIGLKATGRGSYQRSRLTKDGFPRGYLARTKSVHGFRTGDIVKAIVPSGEKAGVYTGRVAVRASGSFNIQTKTGTVQGISHRYCRRLLPGDGCNYNQII